MNGTSVIDRIFGVFEGIRGRDTSGLTGNAGAAKLVGRVDTGSMVVVFPVLGLWNLLACVLALLLVCSTYYQLLNLRVYGLDEVQYYVDFTFKLREEGRWIDYLLHDSLRQIPLPIGAALYVGLGWLLSFRIARNFCSDLTCAIVAASLIVISTPFVEQSLWPVSLLPTLLAMVLIERLSRTTVSHRLIYLLGGALIFGSMQNYYFLIPLFFMGKFEYEYTSIKQKCFMMLDHFVFWIIGSVVGVVVALLVVHIITGQTGIEPASWRKPMPIHNIYDVSRNISYVISQLGVQVRWFVFNMTKWNTVFFVLLIFFSLLRLFAWKRELPRVVVLSAVAISFFAFSVPLAPVIQSRSLVALSVALIIGLFVPCSGSARSNKWISVGLMLWAGCYVAASGYNFLGDYKQGTEYVAQRLTSILPHNPNSYVAVATIGEANDRYTDAAIVNRAPMMRAVVLSTGAKQFWDCQTGATGECEQIRAKFGPSIASGVSGMRYLGVFDGVAVVSVGN